MTPSPGAAPILIEVRGAEPVVFGSDTVWIESIDKALQRYRAEVASRRSQLP